jgi:hypothetical protein
LTAVYVIIKLLVVAPLTAELVDNVIDSVLVGASIVNVLEIWLTISLASENLALHSIAFLANEIAYRGVDIVNVT